MNAKERRVRQRKGMAFCRRLVDILRPLAEKIEQDPKAAAADFREIIEGFDREFGCGHQPFTSKGPT